jgi:hypothetical protein
MKAEGAAAEALSAGDRGLLIYGPYGHVRGVPAQT